METLCKTSGNNAVARENMLKSQILTGHVLAAPVLAALMSVPRELFVPPALLNTAYVDEEIALRNGRFLMEPLAFARLLQHAAIQPHETVLDIGSATGYSSAVLARLAQKVVALEEDTTLAATAVSLLAAYSNIQCMQGTLAEGANKEGPYDVIIIAGAIEFLPPALGDQLREGGRLVTIEHDAEAKIAAAGLGKLVEYKKIRGSLFKTALRNENVTLLPQFKKASSFAF